MNSIVTFALRFAAAELILTAIQFSLRKKEIKTRLRFILIAVKALLGIACAVIVLAGPVQLRFLQPMLFAFYAALFTDAAADLIITIVYLIRKKDRSFTAAKIVSLILGVVFTAFGIYNMQTVHPKYLEYTSDKLKDTHTFVFVADLHVGSAQPFSVTKKTVEEIRSLNPDFVVLGGDITDDYTTKEEMRDTFALFSAFEQPVYYVYGNHDRQGHAQYANGLQYTEEELEKAITDSGVIILKDKFETIAPDLLLLGREDISEGEGRAEITSLVNPDKNAYLIVADHQQTQFKQNLAVGTDLQVSGHTHAGQLFPLRWFYELIGSVYGDYEADGAHMNISAGACGWREPLRTEARCEFEFITLKPAK